jgi:hypothetical protein
VRKPHQGTRGLQIVNPLQTKKNILKKGFFLMFHLNESI